ncbi:hypothetical protein RQP46_006819 [Phenoliferia psychrophenolica]
MLGTTFVFSSGDNGVAGNGNACLTDSGDLSVNGTIFTPSFPSTCPYVLSVGATQVQEGASVTLANSEIACQLVILSGGGFSDNFALPEWQTTAVTSYLTNFPPPYTAAQYNNTGRSRGYPDISANGANYAVAIQGVFGLVANLAHGSAHSGLIALINDARIASGKSTVGFVNPALYSADFAGAFQDITEGGNAGCGTGGFSAESGWDPVTGLGTPNLAKLLPLFLALP